MPTANSYVCLKELIIVEPRGDEFNKYTFLKKEVSTEFKGFSRSRTFLRNAHDHFPLDTSFSPLTRNKKLFN